MNRILKALLATALFASTTAQAAVVTYTNQAAWLAAAGGSVTVNQDFNSVTPQNLASEIDLGGGMSLRSANDKWAIAANASTSDPCSVDGSKSVCGNNGGVLTFSFANSMTAFGATFTSVNDGMLRTRLELMNGSSVIAALTPAITAGQDDQFFGFVLTAGESATALRTKSVIFGDGFGIDNVLLVNASAPDSPGKVPEPGSVAILAIGLLGCAAARRRVARR